VLDWLELHPGPDLAGTFGRHRCRAGGRRDWRCVLVDDLSDAGNLGLLGERVFSILSLGMPQLIGADVIRPGLGWLMATSPPLRITNEMGRVRDPAGLARLQEFRDAGTIGEATAAPAIEKVALKALNRR
jgi:hypothetical protein